MKIAFANDHAAVEARDSLIEVIERLGHQVIDYGVADPDSVDYPDVAEPAVRALASSEVDRTILICGSGIGMSMVANKVPQVRCALVTDLYGAEMSRKHNDANCLALRSREQSDEMNQEIVQAWLATPFEGGRHQGRVEKIEAVGRNWRQDKQTQEEAKQ